LNNAVAPAMTMVYSVDMLQFGYDTSSCVIESSELIIEVSFMNSTAFSCTFTEECVFEIGDFSKPSQCQDDAPDDFTYYHDLIVSSATLSGGTLSYSD
jgi:hypothetical protein